MSEEGDLRFQLVETLKKHWLTGLGCSHEDEGGNQAHCWCGWNGDRVSNVGAAVEQWASHAVEETRDILADALAQSRNEGSKP